MKAWTIEELKLADELCLPEDFERLIRKHMPSVISPRLTFKQHNNDLLRWISNCTTRASLKRGMQTEVDNIISELLGEFRSSGVDCR